MQHSLEQALRVSEAKVASNLFSVHQWSTTSIQIPSPCGSRCLMAMQDARSLTLEVLGHPASAARAVDGQLLGMPRWSSDSSSVAFALISPPHAVEHAARRWGQDVQSLTQILFWNTNSQAWKASFMSTLSEDQADLAMLHWAPTMEHGCRLATSWRQTLYADGITRDILIILSAAGAGLHDGIQVATGSTEKAHAATLHWSPDSSQIALIASGHLWVRSTISEHQLLQQDVAYNPEAIAWAPSGQWVLCMMAFVPAGLEQLQAAGNAVDDTTRSQPIPHCQDAENILSACTAVTWGTPGVVAVIQDYLEIFKVEPGPRLIPQHSISEAFEVRQGRSPCPVTRCSFDWAPGGQWLLCLMHLAAKDGSKHFAVLLVHPASGHTKSMPCQLRRAAKLRHRARMRLATASQWAPDGCSAWVGVLDMDLEKPSSDDAFRQWLLRFK